MSFVWHYIKSVWSLWTVSPEVQLDQYMKLYAWDVLIDSITEEQKEKLREIFVPASSSSEDEGEDDNEDDEEE